MSNVRTSKRSRIASILSWSFTVLVVGVIVAVIVYAGRRQAVEPEPPKKKLANVEVMTVQPQEYREVLTLPARIEADRTAAISAEFPGTLARWIAPEGAFVEKDQVVAELDTEVLKKNLNELHASFKTAAKNVTLSRIGRESALVGLANARQQVKLQELALKSAKSDRNLAQIEFKRIQNLVRKKVMDPSKLDTGQNAITQAELGVERANQSLESTRLGIQTAEVHVKEASTNRDLAKARLIELKAAIASLKVQLKKTRLKAPISGRIEKHLVEPGEFTGAGDPLAHIYDLRFIRAIVNVPDRYIAFLDAKNPTIRTFIQMNMPNAEQRIRVQLILLGLPKLTGENGAGIAFDAEIARIALASDPTSNTYQVELRLPNPGGALRHGMIARGKIEYLYYPLAIVIPVKSVQVTDEGPRVLVVEAEKGLQKVHIRKIEPISIRKDQLLIGRGLERDDRLIIAGWKGLVAGETVNVLVENGLFTDRSLNPG